MRLGEMNEKRILVIVPAFNESGNIAKTVTELFSGVMQSRKRAVLMGQNTAGQVFLKSMFHFDDESMVLLVTARGFFPDGTPFSFKGVVPDQVRQEKDDELLRYAAEYLAVVKSLP